MTEIFKRCVVLPLDREWVPVKGIGTLVSDAVLGFLAAKHANDPIPEHDPDYDPVAEAHMKFGFDDESTEPENVRKAVLECRAAGQIKVREAEGFGIIRDDNVMRGVLARDDFARLLSHEWRMGLAAPAAFDVQAVDAETGDVLPVPRFLAQELAILRQLQAMGENAKALPRCEPWKPGVKAKTKDALNGHRLFVGAKTFDKAWERLRTAGEIRDKP